MYFFLYFYSNKLLRSIHLLQKPFYCSFIIPLLMHNKNRFSTDCTLPRASALLLNYVLASTHGSHTAHTLPTHGSHTAHTRLTHGSHIAHTQLQNTLCSDKHPLKTGCIRSPEYIDSFWSQWLSETVCNHLQQKMALHLLLRTETFMFLRKYFYYIWYSKSHVYYPKKTM